MTGKGEKIISEQARFFMEKGELTLKVKIENSEAAEEIIDWFYNPANEREAELVEVAWDSTQLPAEVSNALMNLKQVMEKYESL